MCEIALLGKSMYRDERGESVVKTYWRQLLPQIVKDGPRRPHMATFSKSEPKESAVHNPYIKGKVLFQSDRATF